MQQQKTSNQAGKSRARSQRTRRAQVLVTEDKQTQTEKDLKVHEESKETVSKTQNKKTNAQTEAKKVK